MKCKWYTSNSNSPRPSSATEITNKPLTAILVAKQVIKESENLSMNDGVALERKLFYPLYDTQGMKEGVNAFIEKRPANMKDLWIVYSVIIMLFLFCFNYSIANFVNIIAFK